MPNYHVVLKKSVLKDIRAIPRRTLERIQSAIDDLRIDPFCKDAEKVRGYEHTYRLRVGRYRIVYEVAKTIRIITIIRIGHRKGVYKRL